MAHLVYRSFFIGRAPTPLGRFGTRLYFADDRFYILIAGLASQGVAPSLRQSLEAVV